MTRKPVYTALSALAVVSVLSLAAPVAYADDTTTTTTTKKTTDEHTGITVGVPGVGVRVGGERDDCKTRKTTKENENTGNTVTRTQTRCD